MSEITTGTARKILPIPTRRDLNPVEADEATAPETSCGSTEGQHP
jgi:hypothetical protein